MSVAILLWVGLVCQLFAFWESFVDANEDPVLASPAPVWGNLALVFLWLYFIIK